MTTKQFAALFVCNVVIYAVGSGLTSLLPVYVTRLGADSTVTGFFLAFAFFALAISNIVGGRLSDRLQKRKLLLIITSTLAAPTTILMSQATTVLQLVILTALLWFLGGIAGLMVNILAGLYSEPGQRGRTFGMLGFSISLGVFLSGLVSGWIVDQWGYPALMLLAGLLYLVVPVAGLLIPDKVVAAPAQANAPAPRGIFRDRTFLFLFLASILVHIGNSGILLSRPLLMDGFRFDATAISTAASIGALATMPLPLLMGWLSDRLGRKPFLILCYLTTTIGLILLAVSVELWHFWAASIFQAVLGVSLVVGSALITDTTPKERLGASLSLFAATPWIGFVAGFGGGGAAISAFQMTPTLMFGVGLSLLAVLLLIPVSTARAAVSG